MSGKTIATLYFYVISAGSIVLMVIGIFNAVTFGINSYLYEKYPLPWGETSCDSYPVPLMEKAIRPTEPMIYPPATPSAEELQRQKQLCLKQQELERKKYQVSDLRNALTFSAVGVVLFLIHFPMARKQSRD
jgi:hypothetical protein